MRADALPEWAKEMQVSVPHGESGGVIIDSIVMDDDTVNRYNLGEMFSHSPRRAYVGTYTGLWIGKKAAGNLWMSDTPDEMRDHMDFIRRAEGHVLITGLGLGMVVQACLRKPEVQQVTVVENHPDVVVLVGDHYHRMARENGKHLHIVVSDAYTWKPVVPDGEGVHRGPAVAGRGGR